jgi:hypothetical protein
MFPALSPNQGAQSSQKDLLGRQPNKLTHSSNKFKKKHEVITIKEVQSVE